MLLNKAIEGFLLDVLSSGKSETTERNYRSLLHRFSAHLGNPEIEVITIDDLRKYMVHSRAEVSRASLEQRRRIIRAFFTWCEAELDLPRPDVQLKPITGARKDVIPFTHQEIDWILKSIDKNIVGRLRHTRVRDRAIVLVLLDTGIRLGEAARLLFDDVDFAKLSIQIRHHARGIKSRKRTVFVGKAASRALWLHVIKNEINGGDSLFGISDRSIQSMLKHIERRSGVDNIHPHRFRHTFAIQFLRNGGNVYTLQQLLGHASLDMVKNYLRLAETDLAQAHRRSSPADNWKL